MTLRLFLSILFFSNSLFAYAESCSFEENFLLINGKSNAVLIEMGQHIDERITPCSTFKITLSLIGFDSGILKDPENPVWLYQESLDDFFEGCKDPQTPGSWIKTSCVWFSRGLAIHLGIGNMQKYLAKFNYGNQDFSGGLTQSWINSSLKISTREQVAFIQKMVQNQLSISARATDLTRKLLYLEDLADGWKLFGKTGWSGPDLKPEFGWFVGWIEKEEQFFPFAYQVRGEKINPSLRIPRTKQLILTYLEKIHAHDKLN